MYCIDIGNKNIEEENVLILDFFFMFVANL